MQKMHPLVQLVTRNNWGWAPADRTQHSYSVVFLREASTTPQVIPLQLIRISLYKYLYVEYGQSHAYMYANINIHMFTRCIYIFTCVYLCVYIYIYIYIHVYVYMHYVTTM